MPAHDELKPPIILLGNVRSGTSLTRSVFDAHPDLCSWREPRTIWACAAPARKHDRFVEEDATPRVVRYIRRRFLQYQREHGGRRIMEKTPSNVLRIPYVRRIFPDAALIYIKRDPFANLGSSEMKWQDTINRRRLLERLEQTPRTQLHYYAGRMVMDQFRKRVLKRKYPTVWGVRYPGIYEDVARMSAPEVIAKQWVHCVRQVDEDVAALPEGTVLRVTYEQIIKEPIETFRAMHRHAGMDLAPGQEAFIRDTIDSSRGRKWRGLAPGTLRSCVPILQEEMIRQGYDLPQEIRDLLEGRISDEQWVAQAPPRRA